MTQHLATTAATADRGGSGSGGARSGPLPAARGPLSAALATLLRTPRTARAIDPLLVAVADDEDLQLALHLCYELHYRGFADVSDDLEWHLPVLDVRAAAERRLFDELRDRVDVPTPVEPGDVPRALIRMVARDPATGLADHLALTATREQFREFAVHRSIYQLMEADPHTWAIPRLTGRAKAALIEIQTDEYGGGTPGRLHSDLFAATLRGLGLDDRPGGYLEEVPAVSLTASNVVSMFGLHRRRRGALIGHLAVLEMDSTLPNRLYGDGARRLGLGPGTTAFFDEHVEADAAHEQVAAHDLCGAFALDHPDLAADVLFGAACCLHTYGEQARHLMRSWDDARSSLRRPLAVAVPS